MSQLAIMGGNKVQNREFFKWPHFDERELSLCEEVVRSRRWFSGMRGADAGSKTRQLEEQFSSYHESKYGIACSNGTVALELALRSLNIGPGDEVIVPGLTFIATLSAVLQVNAIPIVVDTLYENHCIDPEAIENALTERTRAIIPVHFGGFSCDMDRIMGTAHKHNLAVIEDSAHAHGAVFQGRKVGSLGDMATFSFQESKTMTAGEGGMVTTNEASLAERCTMLRSCGRKEGHSWYIHYEFPFNYRLAEIQAALLLAQLERLEDQLETKNQNAGFLNQQLAEIEGIEAVPGDGKTDLNGYYLYLLRYHKESFRNLSRDRFVEALNAEGIPCHIGYPWPLTKNPMFDRIEQGAAGCPYSCPYYGKEISIKDISLPVSERICQETVVIPHQVLLSPQKELQSIPEAIQKIQDHVSELI